MNREREKEAVSSTRVGLLAFQLSRGAHEHSMVLEGRWQWQGRAPCPIATEMAHDWLEWNEVTLKILGSRNNEMNERTAPYNPKMTGPFLSATADLFILLL